MVERAFSLAPARKERAAHPVTGRLARVPNAPDAARPQEVRTDGVRLHIRRWPGGPNGALLIHGLASSSHIWDLVAPRLGRLGVEPVAHDQRGHGRSTKPTSGYGFEQTTADAAAVIRATGLRRPIVVGHSWGANVALEVAVRRPRLVSGAILLDGGFSSMRDRFDWRTAKRLLSPPAFGGIPVEAFVAGIPEHTGLARTPEVEAVVLSLVRVDGRGRVHPRLARSNHLKILHALWAQDTDGLLRRARVPTLVLAARTRDVAPDQADFIRVKAEAAGRIRAIGPPVAFEWIEGIHDVPLQRPQAVARRIARFSADA
jgi:pimeloyl-ACP methyl ester carboxylesterase